jgi:hypothetical protein
MTAVRFRSSAPALSMIWQSSPLAGLTGIAYRLRSRDEALSFNQPQLPVGAIIRKIQSEIEK